MQAAFRTYQSLADKLRPLLCRPIDLPTGPEVSADPGTPAKSPLVATDWILALVVGIVGFTFAFIGSGLMDSYVAHMDMFNRYFNGDSPLVWENMVSFGGDHHRNNVHPLFSLIAAPPTVIVNSILGGEPEMGVRVVTSFVAGFGIATMFILFRLMKLALIDALMFTALVGISAGSMFWFIIPETFTFGAVSIALAFVLVAWSEFRDIGPKWHIANAISTIAYTVTNAMFGAIAILVSFPRKQAIRVGSIAVGIFVVLWITQKLVFPSSGHLLDPREEVKFLHLPLPGATSSFFINTIVVEEIEKIAADTDHGTKVPVLRLNSPVQQTFPEPTAWFIGGAVLWCVIFAIGVLALIAVPQHPRLRFLLGSTLILQLILHLIYGDDPFLYAAHFVPLLIAIAAFSTLTKFRPIILGLTAMLLVCAWVNNVNEFNNSMSFFDEHFSNHLKVVESLEASTTGN